MSSDSEPENLGIIELFAKNEGVRWVFVKFVVKADIWDSHSAACSLLFVESNSAKSLMSILEFSPLEADSAKVSLWKSKIIDLSSILSGSSERTEGGTKEGLLSHELILVGVESKLSAKPCESSSGKVVWTAPSVLFGKTELSGEINSLKFSAEVAEKHWPSQYFLSRDLAAESAESNLDLLRVIRLKLN